MKTLYKIILFVIIPLSILLFGNYTYAVDQNLPTGGPSSSNGLINNHLDGMVNEDTDWGVDGSGQKEIKNILIIIAKDLKNIFFIVAGLYFVIIVVKLIFTGESEEDTTKFKQGILWISIGLMVTQISYSFVTVLYGNEIGEGLAYNFRDSILEPLTQLLETGASFFFIAIAIYSFYRMITANGDEEKTKTGKYSIIYAMAGFIAIKFARTLVKSVYLVNCGSNAIVEGQTVLIGRCSEDVNLSDFSNIVVTIINWMNSLIAIVIIILIIYTGAQVIFSVGDEEVLKKAKKTILYIALGVFLLFANYLILTFFIFPESAIR